MEDIIVNQKQYQIKELLGHGKGGYSYLAFCDGAFYTLKKIHHEPCSYYQFGNKIEAEKRDYGRLKEAGIRIPEMVGIDEKQEIIIKEYIKGKTVFEMICEGQDVTEYLDQVKKMAEQAYVKGINIDYFPTNFIVSDGILYYIDYECNEYMKEWDFENWGSRYWSRTEEFEEYLKHSDASNDNASV